MCSIPSRTNPNSPFGTGAPKSTDARRVSSPSTYSTLPRDVAMLTMVRARGVRHANSIERQPGIILGERQLGVAGAREIVELGELAAPVERIGVDRLVQQRRHPPGEALRLPHPAQAGPGIAFQQIAAAGAIKFGERARQHPHVGNRQIHALGAGRRHDMRGIPRQEQFSVLHRLDHDAAHRGQALEQHLALGKPAAAAEPRVQLPPHALVGPFVEILVGGALQIEPGERRRAHAVEPEAALMVGVDELLAGRRRFRENAEPAERIFPLEARQRATRNAGPAHAMGAVAAGDEIAIDLGDLPDFAAKADARRPTGEIMNADVLDLEQDLAAAAKPRGNQVLDHLLLAIDGDVLADEIGEIQMMQATRKADVDAAVNEAFALQPRAEPGLDQKVGDPLLDHAGANPALDIVAAAPLQHHRVDAFPAQQMREHQPRRPRAYDPTLDEMVEVSFTVNPRVRRIAAHDPHTLPMWEYYRQIFWSTGIDLPEDFEEIINETVIDSIELPPGERASLSLQLPQEFAIVFEPVTHSAQFLDVKGEPTRERQNLTAVFNRVSAPTATLAMRPGPLRLSLENRTDVRVLPGVWIAGQKLHDLLGKRRPFLTAKRLLTYLSCRDVYRTDTLDVDQRLKITSLTFLFTDLKGSTELYERVGDLVAYDLVRAHFRVLNEIIAAEAGAVVKTIGDAVMATLPTPARAIAAALRKRASLRGIADEFMVYETP